MERASLGRHYWCVMTHCHKIYGETFIAQKVMERGDAFDNEHFSSGNYYNSERSAKARIRELQAGKRKEKYRQDRIAALMQ